MLKHKSNDVSIGLALERFARRATEWTGSSWAFASALGASPPRRVPAFPVKVLARALFAWQEGLEGVSNARAKAALDWTPVHGSWRTAFRDP